jgi:hypothetical protein
MISFKDEYLCSILSNNKQVMNNYKASKLYKLFE